MTERSDGAATNLIVALTSNAGNFIAFNGRNGVGLDATAGTANFIAGNSIVSNSALGIDLGNDGPTVNDAAPNDAAVAIATVPTSNTSNVALRKNSASTMATSSVVTRLDSTMPFVIARCSASAVTGPPVKPICTPGCFAITSART